MHYTTEHGRADRYQNQDPLVLGYQLLADAATHRDTETIDALASGKFPTSWLEIIPKDVIDGVRGHIYVGKEVGGDKILKLGALTARARVWQQEGDRNTGGGGFNGFAAANTTRTTTTSHDPGAIPTPGSVMDDIYDRMGRGASVGAETSAETNLNGTLWRVPTSHRVVELGADAIVESHHRHARPAHVEDVPFRAPQHALRDGDLAGGVQITDGLPPSTGDWNVHPPASSSFLPQRREEPLV